MRLRPWMSAKASKGFFLVLGLALAAATVALLYEAASSSAVAQAPSKLEASILSYDGQDFVRTKTTLMTKDGKLAVNTKLEHDTPAYKALVQKHSFSGEATVFGKKYEANYAPLMSEDGKLTGALFVGVAK
jgi:Cache 3/Cache 2 fusion domain